jgi:hypothetical protein
MTDEFDISQCFRRRDDTKEGEDIEHEGRHDEAREVVGRHFMNVIDFFVPGTKLEESARLPRQYAVE